MFQDKKSQFFKPSSERQAIRILTVSSSPIFEVFVDNGDGGVKPFRTPFEDTAKLQVPAREGDAPKAVYYALIYNETLNLLQYWGISQKTIQDVITSINIDAKKKNATLRNVKIFVTKTGTTKMDIKYILTPQQDDDGSVKTTSVPQNVAEFLQICLANNSINPQGLISNEYPLSGIATMQIPKSMAGITDSRMATLIAESDYTVAYMLSVSILTKMNGGAIIEDGITYTPEDIAVILGKKAISIDFSKYVDNV